MIIERGHTLKMDPLRPGHASNAAWATPFRGDTQGYARCMRASVTSRHGLSVRRAHATPAMQIASTAARPISHCFVKHLAGLRGREFNETTQQMA